MNRWRIAFGFMIVAGLVGIGVLPARKGLTVRLTGAAPRRKSVRRRNGLRSLARVLGGSRRRARRR